MVVEFKSSNQYGLELNQTYVNVFKDIIDMIVEKKLEFDIKFSELI